jgi:site-specific DNA-methyltransferase (adenine-specific)
MPISEVHNIDCMEYMRGLPDGFFDLAIIDPPYGIKRFGNRVEVSNRICKSAKINEWDIKPSPEYFSELFRVSRFQIIWGANNFTLPETEYFVIWNKEQTVANFASAEYAWTNIKMPAKVFTYSIHKEMSKRKETGGKIHPTQKPIALYSWLLATYAQPGWKIFDSHMGSQSSRVAAFWAGCDYWGCELDAEYFLAGNKRFEEESKKQQFAFAPSALIPEKPTELF